MALKTPHIPHSIIIAIILTTILAILNATTTTAAANPYPFPDIAITNPSSQSGTVVQGFPQR